MKKLLITLSIFTSILFSFSQKLVAQPPVYGIAVKFNYDGVGQRIKRYMDNNAVLNKFGDTLTQLSPADTIKKQENRFLKDDILVKAYPNPTTDILTIENLSWKNDDKAEIQLYDIAGKYITTHSVTQAKDMLPLNGFAAGTYNVHYYLNGRLLTTWKIIRQ